MARAKRGTAWVFGDAIDTDTLAPGAYMKGPLADLAQHCLETIEPQFARKVRPGDYLVAGRNFGMGSSREQAVLALKQLGVGAVIAVSFARIFFRNALNLALPVLVCRDAGAIMQGDALVVDIGSGVIENLTQRRSHTAERLPDHLMAMIADGGLIPHLKKRFAR
jgi:3-isopropylmalate/(R)-2-methylmalate dehydratase small subunit